MGSKEFWTPHSIKHQTPQHSDSLIAKLRAGRVDVSQMSPLQLHQHMEQEASLRREISYSEGKSEILPTESSEPTEPILQSPIKREPADALRTIPQ